MKNRTCLQYLLKMCFCILFLIVLYSCRTIDPTDIEFSSPETILQISGTDPNTFLAAPILYKTKTLNISLPKAGGQDYWIWKGEEFPANQELSLSLEPGPNLLGLALKNHDGFSMYSIMLYRSLPIYASYKGDLGLPVPETRFDILSDDVIVDQKTGLYWMRNANYPGILKWTSISDVITELNTNQWGGFSDWRIPNTREIRSIREFPVVDYPSRLELYGFTQVQGSYWTSHRSVSLPEYAWKAVLTFEHAPLRVLAYMGNYFWGVRGDSYLPKTGNEPLEDTEHYFWEDSVLQTGIAWPEPRFMDRQDGTILDNMTGLIWMKDAKISGMWDYPGGVQYIENLNNGSMGNNHGYSDWRIPSVEEAETMINYGVPDMALWLETQGFEGLMSQYKTRTPTELVFPSHFALTTINGLIAHNNDVLTNYIWPVRGPEGEQ